MGAVRDGARARRRERKRLALGAGLIVMAAAVGVAATAYAERDRVRGWALYHGHLPTVGRIYGHTADLPESASRCANCHEPARSGLGSAPTARTVSILDARSLTEPRRRRTGPEYAYDRDSFCETLATGIDPVHVIMGRTMPRFALADADCTALWAYLSTR